ncbi:HEAT repeat domain-containing protein [Kitasatospora sp. NPDC051984]|uniref:HEAT repeat domain-containing protein n=1 Tax=Kitasatospora sp. NPDC051984 TaxID=3364059 RepID=UPI0037C6304A
MGPKKLALRLALAGLRGEAEEGFKERWNRACSQTDLKKAVRVTGLPGTETFAGQRISEWLPPDDRAHDARIPHNLDVLMAVVAVWSSWAGAPSLTGTGEVDRRWMGGQAGRWRRLVEDARAERAGTRAIRVETASQLTDAVGPYLERVRVVHRRLNLDVLGPTSRSGEQPAIEIRQVFMPQQCRAYLSHVPGEVRRLLFADKVPDAELPPGLAADDATRLRMSYHSQPARPVLEVLAGEAGRRLVVLGDPGAGKSTLSKYAALALAGAMEEMPPELAPLAGLVPVVVELRHLAEERWRDRCLEDFLDHANNEDRMGITRRLLDELLATGRAAVFFDGLDEIFDPKIRAETARRIAAFAADHPQVRTVVTSREFGYRSNDFASAGFTQVILQDLTRPQVEEFIRRWYCAAHPEKPSLSSQLTQRLLGAVRGVRAVAELAGNPLLLTILASVGLGRTIPRERRAVYAHAVDVLTEQWDSGAKFLTPHAPASSGAVEALEWLEPRNRRRLLQRIARHMQEGTGSSAGTYLKDTELIGLISDFLQQSTSLSRSSTEIAAQHLVQRLRVRNFLLAHFGDGVYGFVHRAFLEYLAAEDLRERVFKEGMSREELLELLGRRAEDPTWHEVLLLLVGGLSHRQVASFIALLLRRHRERDGRGDTSMLMLAIRALAEVDETDLRSGSRDGDPDSSVAAQSRAVIDALIGGFNRAGFLDVRAALPALATFDRFWVDRDRFLRWYYAHSTVRSMYSASSVAAALSRDEAESAKQARHPWDYYLRSAALEVLGERWPDEKSRALVTDAVSDPKWFVRDTALEVLGERWPDEKSRALVTDTVSDSEELVRGSALRVLGERWPDEKSRALVMSALLDPEQPRATALRVLGERWPDEESRAVVMSALLDPEQPRGAALEVLGARWPDEESRALVIAWASSPEQPVGGSAVRVLGERWPDEESRAVVTEAFTDAESPVRDVALRVLAERWPDQGSRALVTDALSDAESSVREVALRVLAERWPDEESRALVTDALSDSERFVVATALRALVDRWPDEESRALVVKALSAPESFVGGTALRALVDRWPDEKSRAAVTAALSDPDSPIREDALWALADTWPDDDTCRVIAAIATAEEGATARSIVTAHMAAQSPDKAWRVIGETLEAEDQPLLKVQAVKLLALLWPDEPGTVPRIRALTTHADENLCRTADEALRWLQR